MTNQKIENEIDVAYAAGVEDEAIEPRAVAVRFEKSNRRLIIELRNGVVLIVPTDILQGMAGASDADIAAVEIEGDGYGLHWENLDVDFTVPGLAAGIFGTKKWTREVATRFLTASGRKSENPKRAYVAA